MGRLQDLVPPLELCKKIPAGEFEDSAFVYVSYANGNDFKLFRRTYQLEASHNDILPAPTFDEILDELKKSQEDVFVKWSETAYHEWLVNAYSHGRNEDYQAHDENKTTAALKVWLKMKGLDK